MTGYPSSDAHENSRWWRRLLLLLLLLIPFALGAISVEWLHGAPKVCSEGTPSVSSGRSPRPSDPGTEEVGGAEATPYPVPTVVGSRGAPTQAGGDDFKIAGGGVRNLMPGVTKTIALTLTNPNGIPIYVTALTVTVSTDSTPPGCTSEGNLQITQSNVSSADPIAIPANGSVTLTSPPRAPQITLLNLPNVNQDACKSKVFDLTYSGSARS
jgi:hypothetical protein